MNDDVETVVRRELAAVANEVLPRPGWSQDVWDNLEGERDRRPRRAALTLVCAAAVVVLVVLAVGRPAPDQRPAPAPAPGERRQLVDIGGRDLSVACQGAADPGDPTVILETSLGGSAAAYDRVGTLIARDLRVCTYDRAGTGASHAATDFPRTARSVADDLAALVRAGDLGPSIVLVTEGFTGLSGAVLASDHPELVAGLVFLDPRGPHVSRAQRESLGRKVTGEPRALAEARRAFVTDSMSLNGEQISWPASEAEAAAVLDRPGPAFGDIPTVVLTAERGQDLLPPLSPRIRSLWWDALAADREQLAAESTSGRLEVVPNVSGSLPSAAPVSVVDAVLAVARSTG